MPARNAKINVAVGRNVRPGALNGIGRSMYNTKDKGVENSINKTPARKGTIYLLLRKIDRTLRDRGKN
jgi:hypothetical protein